MPLTRLATVKAAERVEAQIKHTVEQGANIIYGGKRDGCAVDVTVLDNVTKDMDVAKDLEIFGPVIPLIEFEADEEAVAIANQSKYGLSACVITKDIKKAFYFTENVESSAVWVNGSSALRHNDQPFGGCKSTGIGIGLELYSDDNPSSADAMIAAESRIRDMDMAKGMMSFAKDQILIQAAQSMLAQANNQPQQILSLLRS